MPFDSRLVIYPLDTRKHVASLLVMYPLDTRKQLIPQKNGVNIFYQLATFSSGRIGNSHIRPGLEKGVDGVRQLLFYLRETPSQW